MSKTQEQIAELEERVERLESQVGGRRNGVTTQTLPGNEFQFQDLAEGETFLWNGGTWRKVGPNHAENVEPFRQYVPAHDAVDPITDVQRIEADNVEGEPEPLEGKASREDRAASVSSQDA